jgi:diguanylate cyclase (GGDEF)-like protein
MNDQLKVTTDMLASLDALRGVSDETLEQLIVRASFSTLAPGAALLRRGEPNSRMYVVVSGELRVDLDAPDGAPLARIGTGETVGEMSLLGRQPATATVVAEKPTRLLAIDEASFYWLIHVSHGFAVSLLTRLAARLSSNNEAVQANIALRQQFEHAALHDALTGVHSRRWLHDALPRLVQRHVFATEALSIAILDVDHFKRVNDTYGHPAGDAVLVSVGRVLRDKLRPTDLVARMGGEEFVLVFPQTELWGGIRAAERLRIAIAAEPMRFNGADLPNITVSLGVTALGQTTDAQQLLAEADQALYRAKQSGRNRTESFTAPTPPP